MSKKDFDKITKQPPPFSIRFSWDQRAELDRLTHGQPWAGYIKDVLFVKKFRPQSVSRIYDRQILATLLGALGKSRIASNINQLAKAANSGSLPVNEEVVNAIISAVRAIEWMKITLIEGMGLKARNSDKSKDQDHDP